jgi:hypothetical protein
MYKYGERGGVVMDITNQCILPVQTVLRMVWALWVWVYLKDKGKHTRIELSIRFSSLRDITMQHSWQSTQPTFSR